MSISPLDIDDCDPDPCPNGDCEDGVDSYTCDCDLGFTGVNCETSEIVFLLHRLFNLGLYKLTIKQCSYIFLGMIWINCQGID